jgi:hypothetical protein
VANYEFRVVPFRGQIKTGVFSSEGPQVASKQLEELINQSVSQGWEFVEVSHINILTEPGCIAGLLGQRAMNVPYDQVVFRKVR